MAEKYTYKVQGMHCKSCEILIENKLLDLKNIKSVNASTPDGKVTVEYEGQKPGIDELNKIFEEDNYKFLGESQLANSHELANNKSDKEKANPTLVAFNIAIFIIIGFLILERAGVASFMSVSSASSLVAFFGFGLLAGVSSCAALVGGIVLSMSKQWNSLYTENEKSSKKLQPHLMFNAGRVVSYAFFGGILGLIGNKLQISAQFTGLLILAVSFLMIVMGLQMLGVKAFRKFQISAPKSTTRQIANENNFKAKYAPFLMGALTFFLPCGFTITAQGLALLSQNAIQGGLIMGAFALGTVPTLLFIGLSSVKFSTKPHLAERFSKVAGFLVLFFALVNISNQMTVLGFSGVNFGQSQNQVASNQNDLPKIVNGQQVIKMTAYASKNSPNYFKVKAGVPVKWEITAANSLGCNGAIISANLFNDVIDLTPGQVTIKEFTPQKPGKYVFSCTMGMIRGTIEVVK